MITLSTIGKPARTASPLAGARAVYLERIQHLTPSEGTAFADEAAWQRWLASRRAASAWVVLLDSRGRTLTSEQFAAAMGMARDAGRRDQIFAIGPADGWSTPSLKSADLVLSFGAMTLPHELAAVVCAEQVYRALTILAGHPYHLGHR